MKRMTREEAIMAVKEVAGMSLPWNDRHYEALQMAIKALEEPERKKGEWIIKDNPGTGWYRVTCSECGEDVTSTAPCIGFYPNAKVTWDYCPDCGSYNGGENDDQC